MSDDINAPGRANAPSQAWQRPLGGFSPSSPQYRPLPPLDIPPDLARETDPLPVVRPNAASMPPPGAEYPTVPDGYPTPGRVPAYPVPGRGPAYPVAAPRTRPLVMPPPPTRPRPQRPRSGTAPVVIEAVGAFFGIFGLGWLMTGRNTTGILLLLGGLVWDVIGLGLITSGVGACCFLPVHVVFIALTTVLLSNHIRRSGYI